MHEKHRAEFVIRRIDVFLVKKQFDVAFLRPVVFTDDVEIRSRFAHFTFLLKT